ncbi:MAG TPA: DUF3311 domain-containing protein [Oleiagrimonas sp.]|nr:DUF3311 domain-containing protein [Oleiagrimonas sp.]
MRTLSRWLPIILLLPCIALLWVPFYNRIEPQIGGFPFFYVWLVGWTVITAALTWLVWRVQKRARS